MRDLEKLWVICYETQSELEIFLLFIMGQTKPTHNRHAFKRDTIRGERINDRVHVAIQSTEVDDGSTVINNIRKIADRFSAYSNESHFELVSSQGLVNPKFFALQLALLNF